MKSSESSDQAETTSLEEHTHQNYEADDADIKSQDAPSTEKGRRECGDLWHMIRLVVDSADVGRVVGKNGRHIRMIRSETKARVKILDGVPGSWKSTIMVTSEVKFNSDAALVPPAVNAVVRIHRHLIGGIESRNFGRSPGAIRDVLATYLLIPANQMGFLIGQKGEAINAIRRKSGAKVRTFPLSTDLQGKDRVVEIVGTAFEVHEALQLIVTHMMKLPVGRNIVAKLEGNGRKAIPTTVTGGRAESQSPPRWLRGSPNTNQAPRHKGEKTGTVEGAEFDGLVSTKATRYTNIVSDGSSEGQLTQTGTPSPVLQLSPSSVSSNSPTYIYQNQIMQQHQETILESCNMDAAVMGVSLYPSVPCHLCTKSIPTAPNQVLAVPPSMVPLSFTPQIPAKHSTGESFNSGFVDTTRISLGQRFEFDPSYGSVDPAALSSPAVYYQYPVHINQYHTAAAAAQPVNPTWPLGPTEAYRFANASPNYAFPPLTSGSYNSYGYSPFTTLPCPWMPSYASAGSYGGYLKKCKQRGSSPKDLESLTSFVLSLDPASRTSPDFHPGSDTIRMLWTLEVEASLVLMLVPVEDT
ncbi:hypothetical protein R1sor_025361 [Riccia sorocarpa]|uniref:K Homology domain-containing protein n=1 Tax=Riccia sorocarpa TaxID=122646 RepID=A0ABD3G8Y0_9MARC